MRQAAALAAGGALSVALHAALLPLLDAGSSPRWRPGTRGVPAATDRLQLRWLLQPQEQATPSAAVSTRTVPMAQQRDSLDATIVPLAPAAADVADPQPSRDVGSQRPGGEQGDEFFLPRSALTVGPAPRSVVIVPYPQFEGDVGQYTTELLLFIDASGFVRRLEIDGDDLPEPLRRAVHHAFVHAEFRPGELDGRAVGSRIRIQVTFGGAPALR